MMKPHPEDTHMDDCINRALHLENADLAARLMKAEARALNLEELVKVHERLHETALLGRNLAEVRVVALEALCAEAVLRQYSGEWPSWFTNELSDAGQGLPIRGRSARRGDAPSKETP